jgi:pimeloyl-ACP methyl ester carboxylesterase
MSKAVVMVHGLWMTGMEMHWLGNRLEECGFQPHYFHYPSLTQGVEQSAAQLYEFVSRLEFERVHIVAHSMGGVVTLNMFDRYDLPDHTRVLMLGTPVLGSGVARVMASHGWMRPLLGAIAPEALTETASHWRGAHQLGIIAGTSAVGIGRLIGGLEGESDGTVAVAETRLPGATDFRAMKVNHMGMLLSAEVASESCFFLHYGHFDKGEGAVSGASAEC